jgi:2-methylcitrate dehydratase
MEDDMHEDDTRPRESAIGRRDAIKLGAGAVVTVLNGVEPLAWAQGGRSQLTRTPGSVSMDSPTRPNGPADAVTRQIVSYVNAMSEQTLTAPLLDALGTTLVDSIACTVAGSNSEPAHIAARLAKLTRGDLKSTVVGHGVTTTPELAAFANTCMVRHADYNDIPHYSDLIPGILAVGEAIHASGTAVLIAITAAYDVAAAIPIVGAPDDPRRDGWDYGLGIGAATAIGVGKLLKLTDDQMANALSLSIVPQVQLRVTRAGILSMWKGCATASSVRNGIFAALIAREGMTGPAEPFEGRDGLWEQVTGKPRRELRLPASPDGRTALQRMHEGGGGFKRYPSEGYTQSLLEKIPEIRAWTKVEEIASVKVELCRSGFLEIGDAPKWNPLNRETADHSMAFDIASALIDGEVWLTSFTPQRIIDPGVRLLMQKITVVENPEFPSRDRSRITVRKGTGEELIREAGHETPMSRAEIDAKFDRVLAGVVPDGVRDRMRTTWSNLRSVRDIAEPMIALAHVRRTI